MHPAELDRRAAAGAGAGTPTGRGWACPVNQTPASDDTLHLIFFAFVALNGPKLIFVKKKTHKASLFESVARERSRQLGRRGFETLRPIRCPL